MYHPESHIVYAVKGSDVRDVMIAGRWVVKDRRALTLDIDAVLIEAEKLGSIIAGQDAPKDERC